MGLAFTSIPDKHGSAIYFIHDGSDSGRQKFQELMEDVERKTTKQTVLMSIDDDDAQKIISFYKLRGSFFVLIIRDDDQLHHVWSDGELLDASKIAFTVEQAG